MIDDVRVISMVARRAARRGLEDVVREILPETDYSPEAELGRKFGLGLTIGALVFGVGLALYVALSDD